MNNQINNSVNGPENVKKSGKNVKFLRKLSKKFSTQKIENALLKSQQILKEDNYYHSRYSNLLTYTILVWKEFLEQSNYYKNVYELVVAKNARGSKEFLILCFLHFAIFRYSRNLKNNDFDLVPFTYLSKLFKCDRTYIFKIIKKFKTMFSFNKLNKFNKKLFFTSSYFNEKTTLSFIFKDLNIYFFRTQKYYKLRAEFAKQKRKNSNSVKEVDSNTLFTTTPIII